MSQGVPYRAGLEYLRPTTLRGSNPNLVRYRGKFYRWQGGCYRPATNEDVQSDVTRWLARNEGVRRNGTDPMPVSNSFVRDVMLAITAESAISSDLDLSGWIRNQPAGAVGPFLGTVGGILDLGRLNDGLPATLDPSPDYFALSALPHHPNTENGHPILSEFLANTFGGNDDLIRLVQEMFGYCLWPDCRYEVAFILLGDGNSGKSTIAETITAMLSPSHVSAVPLERIGDRFALPAIVGKLANIVFDTGEIEKSAEGVLKALISGEPVAVEEKNLPLYTMRVHAKHIFLTNVLPRFHDTSSGIWRRLRIIPFDVMRPVERCDATLKSRLLQELPAITAWALQGLNRLNCQGHFTSVQRSIELHQRYREESNPVCLFLAAECLEDSNSRISRQMLYQHYKVWASDNGHSQLSSTRFYREVAALHRQPNDPPRAGRGGDRLFVGLRFRAQIDVYEHLRLSIAPAEAS